MIRSPLWYSKDLDYEYKIKDLENKLRKYNATHGASLLFGKKGNYYNLIY